MTRLFNNVQVDCSNKVSIETYFIKQYLPTGSRENYNALNLITRLNSI